jgi:hypothetical protein
MPPQSVIAANLGSSLEEVRDREVAWIIQYLAERDVIAGWPERPPHKSKTSKAAQHPTLRFDLSGEGSSVWTGQNSSGID